MQINGQNGKCFKMIIAGGKTGGHLFPGIAIALAVKRENISNEILFVGTGDRFEVETLENYGFKHTSIDCSGLKGKNFKAKSVSALKLPVSVLQAIRIIRKFDPDFVLGVGGYSAGPVVLAARLCGVKTGIHEQNSIPGLTNRILSAFVDVIFTSFDKTEGFLRSQNIICFGNPIRRTAGIRSENEVEFKDKSAGTQGKIFNGNSDDADFKFTILVTGGSQGASSINTAFINAVKLMEHPEKYNIIHQTGKNDENKVIREYEKMGIGVKAGAFFYDMPDLQKTADLIICRAGAGTIAEISASGKPSILIPYPYAANDHQFYNACYMAERGAAWVLKDHELTGEKLKRKIEFAADNPQILASMSEAAKKLSLPNADRNIALKCIEMCAGRRQGENK